MILNCAGLVAVSIPLFVIAGLLTLGFIMEFLRRGHGGQWLRAVQRTQYKADSAIVRSDGFDLGTIRVRPSDVPRGINGQKFDRQHSHWLSVILLYYMTGDERLREAIVDYGEILWQTNSGAGDSPSFWGPPQHNFRTWSRVYRDLALVSEMVPEQPRYRDALFAMTSGLLDSRDEALNPTKPGRNLERGYIWTQHRADMFSSDSSRLRAISQNIGARIHPEAQVQVLRVLGDVGYPRLEEVIGLLEGVASFTYHEFFFRRDPIRSRRDGGFWSSWVDPSGTYHNNYALDSPNVLDARSDISPQDACALYGFMWRRSGDPKWLERSSFLLMMGAAVSEGYQVGHPDCMQVIADDVRRVMEPEPGWRQLPIAVTPVAGGTEIRWQAPSGARLLLKGADRPIVEWLGFDQLTRRFALDPAQHVTWSAARPVATPTPVSGEQTVVVPPGPTHFAARYWSASTVTDVPPTLPGALHVDSSVEHTLSWSASPDADLAHYRVLRNGEEIATVTEPRFVDRAPPAHYVYTIIAVDQAGNESPPISVSTEEFP